MYVNGCSHTAAAESVVGFAFAEDDGALPYNDLLGRQPHPLNLAASWCTHLARDIDADLICHAESGSSNARIIRTTKKWIQQHHAIADKLLCIIQWSTWEREEWFHHDHWYQVNASGVDIVPRELETRYREYVINIDWSAKTQQAHDQIWDLHRYLDNLGVRHVFYNSWSTFSDLPESRQRNWNGAYIDPYQIDRSYAAILRDNGFDHTKFYHFGPEAHRFWAQYVLQYVQANNLG